MGKHGWFEKTEAEKERERQEQLKAEEEAKREAERQEVERACAAGISVAKARWLAKRVREVLEDYAEVYLSQPADLYEVQDTGKYYGRGLQWALVNKSTGRTEKWVGCDEGMLGTDGVTRTNLKSHRQSTELAHALHKATGLRVKVVVKAHGVPWSAELSNIDTLYYTSTGPSFTYIIPDEDYPGPD